MTLEKWQQIKGQILDGFKDAEIENQDLEEPEKGKKEIIIFNGPLGQMKIEFITKPVLLDKRTHGSRRIGSFTEVEYIYSDDEFTHSLKAYKWDDNKDDWTEIDLKNSFNI